MSGPAVVFERVSKHYGRLHRALDDVGVSVPAGRCLALLGHNGAGKTTLMKLVLGLTAPTAGVVRVLGRDPMSGGVAHRRDIGFLPENVAFDDAMTGRDLMRFYARLKKAPLARCDELIETVGLGHAAGRRVKTYSKGMRQRLGLAQALLGEPTLLLFDEPTTGLDPVLRQAFFATIQDLTTRGATIILSSHILTELEARTDLVAIMRHGRLVAMGNLDDLRRLAALPLRIRIVTRDAAGAVVDGLGGAEVVRVDGRVADIVCPLAEKMPLLQHIAGLGPAVADVDVQLPTLDDVYLHFTRQPGDGAAP